MKTCPGCTVDVEIGEWGYRVRLERVPASEGSAAFCVVDDILNEHNESVSDQRLTELKPDALKLGLEKCAQVYEGRRDAADETRYDGHVRL